MEQNQQSAPIMIDAAPKNGNGLKIATAVASIVALCGIGFGVYGMMKASEKKDTNPGGSTECAQVDDNTNDGGDDADDVIVDVDTTSVDSYIYIAQWNIKVALPSTLKGVSYSYEARAGFTDLTIWGTDCSNSGQCQYVPDFSDPEKNSPLGAILRYHKNNIPERLTNWPIIATIDDHNYYYEGPQDVYSTDSEEQSWEMSTVQLIKEALTNPDNYSEIK